MTDHRKLAPLIERIEKQAGRRRPAIVGVGGSVAVGKSTAAEELAGLLRARPAAWTVEVVSTDAFLLPNTVLNERSLALRKGFPESFDAEGLSAFLGQLRQGEATIRIPVYDHQTYDIVDTAWRTVGRADVVVLEGVNALAEPAAATLDVAVYLDAAEADVRRWYVERFVALAGAAGVDPDSFYRRWAALPAEEVAGLAGMVWDSVNAANLALHIEPTRQRADVVLVKGPDHELVDVRLTN